MNQKVSENVASIVPLPSEGDDLLADPGYVQTETAAIFEDAHERCKLEPRIVIVIGGYGGGKTTMINYCASQCEMTTVITLDPCHSSVTAGLKATAEALVGRFVRGQSAHQLFDEVWEILRDDRAFPRFEGRVPVLIVDEAQYATPKLIDSYRAFHDAGLCSLVLCGNPNFFSYESGRLETAIFGALYSRRDDELIFDAPSKKDIAAYLDACRVRDPHSRDLLTEVGKRRGLRGIKKVISRALELTDDAVQFDDLQVAASMLTDFASAAARSGKKRARRKQRRF